MNLDDDRESSNVEDRRGGGIGKAGGIGVGTVVIALVASYFLGVDPLTILNVANQVQGSPGAQMGSPLDPANDPDLAIKLEVEKILARTEDSWGAMFREMGGQYQVPKLVLYSGRTPTACGAGDAAMGPFYCPGDQKVYLDMTFFREMENRFRAGGDFARAYVIAHEIGHHVQNLIGITERTDAMRRQMSEKDFNRVSVKVELQADCFAGVWANHSNRVKAFLQPNDVDEALRAANAIGDDMLQKKSRGVVVPDSFTHGSSAQRVHWFKTGFESGSLRSCDTFAVRDL
ncbi:MAG: neutral zinc metallopeptidase [Betaproteobacteria bacterium]|nr:neutral zinc metallopeptidase [Betaproteobacteria bacterium]